MIAVSEAEKELIKAILYRNVPQSEVRVFGSRHRGTNKPYSDLDLAINGELTGKQLADLRCEFEECRLPYRVDVLDYRKISPEFRIVIDAGYTVFPG
ncbi:MAG: nucleotidyltransferase domain-containing protein [Candidatus Margulisbacteria bacterium]|jgi:predicted nucleotidyltransferase|nr:nucleotidyltransferase domain-containing protein [Candidatus Margulisiibacteriota bacterium]